MNQPDQWQADMHLLGATHPFARAVQAMLDEGEQNEVVAVCQPHLTDGDRHFNAGRLAAMKDIATLYREVLAAKPERGERGDR